ncbi:substrate-binding domain-containing protein [Roseivivax sp. CAU 1761]
MPDFLTVRELADLLRIKERKVYDLASSGAVPCSKVTGKLLFPEREIRAWIARGALNGAVAPAADRPPVFLGSHDPLLDWALRQAQAGLATLFDGSQDGLTRFVAGEGVATGLHLYGGEAGWNVAAVEAEAAGTGAVLLGFARRWRGLVVRPGSGIAGLDNLPGRRMVPRQAGSGTESVFDHLLAEAGLRRAALTLTEAARNESDAVLAVQQGAADATFGLQALAEAHGLDFRPLIEERFDILVDRKAWFDPALQRFAAFLASAAFRDQAARMPGYDVAEAGRVRWNG